MKIFLYCFSFCWNAIVLASILVLVFSGIHALRENAHISHLAETRCSLARPRVIDTKCDACRDDKPAKTPQPVMLLSKPQPSVPATTLMHVGGHGCTTYTWTCYKVRFTVSFKAGKDDEEAIVTTPHHSSSATPCMACRSEWGPLIYRFEDALQNHETVPCYYAPTDPKGTVVLDRVQTSTVTIVIWFVVAAVVAVCFGIPGIVMCCSPLVSFLSMRVLGRRPAETFPLLSTLRSDQGTQSGYGTMELETIAAQPSASIVEGEHPYVVAYGAYTADENARLSSGYNTPPPPYEAKYDAQT